MAFVGAEPAPHFSRFMIAQRIQEICLREEFVRRFFHVQIEVAQNHVLTRRNDRLTILRTQNVVGTEHQDFRFGTGFFGQRQMDSHLVAVKVGVERGTD